MTRLPGKIVFSVLMVLFLSTGHTDTSKQWAFEVYLDDKKIGSHRFTVQESAEQTHVTSEARFDVKFLFINAYRYRHYNHEIWDDSCLISIRARTDDNGEDAYVTGKFSEDTLQVDSSGDNLTLPGCVRSFAYWNPAALMGAEQLLNPQTGEYQPVSILSLPDEKMNVGDVTVLANRYRIIGEDLHIDLWYSQDDEWLALESQVRDGSTLRYLLEYPDGQS